VVPKSYTDYMTRYDTSKAARILKIASGSAGTSKVAARMRRAMFGIIRVWKRLLRICWLVLKRRGGIPTVPKFHGSCFSPGSREGVMLGEQLNFSLSFPISFPISTI
jgi:hypothetical protein